MYANLFFYFHGILILEFGLVQISQFNLLKMQNINLKYQININFENTDMMVPISEHDQQME